MNKAAHSSLAAERRKARHYGMQALYQWLMAGAALNEIEAEFGGTITEVLVENGKSVEFGQRLFKIKR